MGVTTAPIFHPSGVRAQPPERAVLWPRDAEPVVGEREPLSTLGWVLIVLGVIQLTAGFSLWAGHAYGRWLGIIGAGLGAIGALLSIGEENPWWSLGVFVLCLYVIHGIFIYGEDERAARA